MNPLAPCLLVLTTLLPLPMLPNAIAEEVRNDIEISFSRTRLDKEKDKKDSNLTVTAQKIAYDIELENKSFDDFGELTVKYMVFYEDSKPGATTGPVEKFVKGSEKVEGIRARDTTEIQTKPVKIESAELDTGWVWSSGASNKTRDRVLGVWCRVYHKGTRVGEYVNPSSLARRHEWED